jgi:hypothetical protein
LGTAPYELWGDLPGYDPHGDEETYRKFVNLVYTVNESPDVMEKLPPRAATQLADLARHDLYADSVILQVGLGSEVRELASDPRDVLDNASSLHLLALLQAAGYEEGEAGDPALRELMVYFRERFRDDSMLVGRNVAINGRLLPIPEDINVIVGVKRWEVVTRKYDMGALFTRRILFVPDSGSSAAVKKILRVAGIFKEGVELSYDDPLEEAEDLKWDMLEADGALSAYVSAERYLTILHTNLMYVAKFIEWAEEDEQTHPLAQKLREGYEEYVAVEVDNLTRVSEEASSYGIVSPFESLVRTPLPPLEVPSRFGRATAHLSLEEHKAAVESAEEKRVYTIEDWRQQIRDILEQPLSGTSSPGN